MRTRTALPLLLCSLGFMVFGLSLANAQQQDENPQQQDQPGQAQPPGVPGLSPALKQKLQTITRPQPAETEDSGTSGPPSADGSGINEFQTGIDYRPMSPGARVTFNLEDADLPDLVRLISNITGKRFIISGKVRSIKATVFAPSKVTASEAYHAFLSILQANDLTIVPSGRYLKIVETQGIENQPVSTYLGGGPTPSEDRFITRMHRVTNVSAEDVVQLLTRFKSPQGNVTAYAPTNVIFMTDTGTNIRRMLRVVQEIDVPSAGEHIWIERIYYAAAADIAEKLQEIFPVGQAGGAQAPATGQPTTAQRRTPPRPGKAQANQAAAAGNIGSRPNANRITKIIPEERTNSLIIMATERAYMRIMAMIRLLDVPIEGEGQIHVHYVQNGDAEDLASTLSSLLSGGGNAGQTGNRRTPTARAGQQAQAAAAGATAVASGDLFTGEIRVTAHTPSNALVIVASLHDYTALRRVIEELDAPRRQVFIESVIMELSIDRSSNLGFAFHGGIPDLPSEGSLSVLGFQAGQSISPLSNQEVLTSLAVGVQGPQIPEAQQLIGLSIPGFGVVMTALATAGDVNILSTPHIMAMDNVQAEISVGDNIPLQTSGTTGALGGLGGLAGLAGLSGAQGDAGGGAAGLAGLAGLAGSLGGALPRQDVGTTIRITPHINDNDEIRMEIEQEISEAGASSGPFGAVAISRRTAKTELMVRDQQTVVIGGLVRDRVSTTERKVPILGDIPLIGALFRSRGKQKQKRNLLLFLTPYVIRDQSDLRAIFERKMQERQEFLDRYFVFGDHDYEPPVDYSRTRGLVSEIINEIDSIDSERHIIEEARGQPPPEHIPQAPVGSLDPSEMGREEGDIIIGPEPGEPAPITGDLPDSVNITPDLPQVQQQDEE